MSHANPKVKGAEFEREVCKKLSLWLSNGEREDLLWRSAMSGGRHTLSLRKSKGQSAQAGDISSIDLLSASFMQEFCIECKFYKDLNIKALLFGGKQGILDFWKQACRDADSVGKKPLLIVKQNFQKPLIAFRGEDWRVFFDDDVLSGREIVRGYFPYYNLSILRFSDFLSYANY